jgi:hypothetical protein
VKGNSQLPLISRQRYDRARRSGMAQARIGVCFKPRLRRHFAAKSGRDWLRKRLFGRRFSPFLTADFKTGLLILK